MKFLILVLLVITILFFIRPRQISNFVTNTAYTNTDVSPANDDTCAAHCVTGSDGRVMDDYDCCQCRATGSAGFGEDPGYDKRFRICMCQQAGRRDFCYRPVTNLILSQ